jgi:hypothetical protein
MVRRTVAAIGILCGASAAAALAFASDISRARSNLVERAIWRRHGFTAVPASGTGAYGGDRRLVGAPGETPRGKYCRLPPSRTSIAAPLTPTDTPFSNSVVSTPLLLEGQSRIPNALPPALCAGDTVGTPPARSSKP